ncbi:Hypothetical_protein [Hexamita inflata]|uniref:Hypothetical_protein n=1 Tax=Hexamita inflata TaxID=28002 RepID=A0AA86UJE3_9EUKA|nr:Hypothetical protein HINF_LOCUS29883 [Hexamita inflata]
MKYQGIEKRKARKRPTGVQGLMYGKNMQKRRFFLILTRRKRRHSSFTKPSTTGCLTLLNSSGFAVSFFLRSSVRAYMTVCLQNLQPHSAKVQLIVGRVSDLKTQHCSKIYCDI